MAENTPPPTSSFCVELERLTTLPAIHFPGGQILQPQIDPTRGIPGACGLSIDLVGKLDSALAPLQPLFTLLDCVAHLAQCFLLLTEVVSNPFKIPDLLGCIPELLGKVNGVLALVPPLPQGVVQIVTFVVDVVRFAAVQIGCVVDQLRAVDEQLKRVEEDLKAAERAEDPQMKAAILELAGCGRKSAEASASTALSALGPIARILCTVRSFLVLTGPEGKKLAQKLQFPDPTNIETLDEAISLLGTVKTTLLDVVTLVEALALPFGGLLPAPEVGFRCPIDTQTDDTPAEEVVAPRLDSLTNLATGVLVSSLAPLPVGGADQQVKVVGDGFTDRTTLYWMTTQLTIERVVDPSTLNVKVPGTLLRNAGEFQLTAANAPANAPQQFAGIAGPGEDPASRSSVKTSNQLAAVVG